MNREEKILQYFNLFMQDLMDYDDFITMYDKHHFDYKTLISRLDARDVKLITLMTSIRDYDKSKSTT